MKPKKHPDRMLSDIEQRWYNGCNQYWNVKDFYINSKGLDCGYCRDCQRENVREAQRRRKEMNAAKAKTPPEIKKRNPKPKPTVVRTTEAVSVATSTTECAPPSGTCATCKAYSKYNGGKSGWCMRRRKTVRWREWCGDHKPNTRVRYEQVATPVSVNRSSPWD